MPAFNPFGPPAETGTTPVAATETFPVQGSENPWDMPADFKEQIPFLNANKSYRLKIEKTEQIKVRKVGAVLAIIATVVGSNDPVHAVGKQVCIQIRGFSTEFAAVHAWREAIAFMDAALNHLGFAAQPLPPQAQIVQGVSQMCKQNLAAGRVVDVHVTSIETQNKPKLKFAFARAPQA